MHFYVEDEAPVARMVRCLASAAARNVCLLHEVRQKFPVLLDIFRGESDLPVSELGVVLEHLQARASSFLNLSSVVEVRVALLLDIPVLDGPNNVALVSLTELDLHLVPSIRFGVLKQQVEPAGPWLAALPILKIQVAQSQNRRVRGNLVLKPFLIQTGSIPQWHDFRLERFHRWHPFLRAGHLTDRAQAAAHNSSGHKRNSTLKARRRQLQALVRQLGYAAPIARSRSGTSIAVTPAIAFPAISVITNAWSV